MHKPMTEQEREALRQQLARDRTVVDDILNHLHELLWQRDEEQLEFDGAAACVLHPPCKGRMTRPLFFPCRQF